jgi:hypothetical protein
VGADIALGISGWFAAVKLFGGPLSLGAIGIANATLPGFMQEKEKGHFRGKNGISLLKAALFFL